RLEIAAFRRIALCCLHQSATAQHRWRPRLGPWSRPGSVPSSTPSGNVRQLLDRCAAADTQAASARYNPAGPSEKPMPYSIQVNGQRRTVDVEGDTPVLWVLRDELDLKGTKFGCGMALCGACTVHIDGVPTRACITPIAAVGDRAITTVEGIDQESEVARKLKAAWLTLDVMQCGYCQAGQIMAATALLTRNPHPTDADIDAANCGKS